jgi:hypothetical protein
MVNLTHLRNTHPVITVSEYLRLHNISENVERSDGHWARNKYHMNPNVLDRSGKMPSLHIIENQNYDPSGIVRVDMIPRDIKERGEGRFEGGQPLNGENVEWEGTQRTPAYVALKKLLRGKVPTVDWDQARHLLQSERYIGVEMDETLERFLNDNGWEVLYTYGGA